MGVIGSEAAQDALIKVRATGKPLYGDDEEYEVETESNTCIVPVHSEEESSAYVEAHEVYEAATVESSN